MSDKRDMFLQLVLPEVKMFIQGKDEEALKYLLDEFFPQDVAEIMDELTEEERSFLFQVLPKEQAIEVFSELDYPEQEEILQTLNEEMIGDVLNDMAPDDRTELFEDLPEEMAQKYLEALSPEEQDVARRYMAYPEYSVARLATPDFVKLSSKMSVQEAISHLRTNYRDKETIYYSYILDENGRLDGVISLKELILAEPESILEDIIDYSSLISVEASMDQEKAAEIMNKYDLIALPVIGSGDKMIGIVTFDDLVDVVQEEATEDIHKMGGMLPTEDNYLDTPFKEIFKNRVLWLVVLLVLQSITGMVLKRFETVLDQVVALSFFIPLLIGTGGNAGTQSATLVIRGLATGEISNGDLWPLIKKELLLAGAMGIILAVLTFGRVYLQESAFDISIVVSLGLLTTMTVAMISGTILPVFFKTIKLDPALMSGPFISTSIDIIGLVIYLQIARVILGI
ncbi:magnesium transporter [bacterium]|nr:magnesium transporter [bacterium]